MIKYLTFFLTAFLLVAGLAAQDTASSNQQKTSLQKSSNTFILYYFYNRTRCPTCIKFESITKEILSTDLKSDVSSGALTGKFINTDDSENGHYIKDYKLFTKSIIISEVKDGKEIRWKNLDKIWTLAANTTALKAYILKEIKMFRDGKKS